MRVGIIKSLIMIRIREMLRSLFQRRSISFRLYLIVVPATILAISLITYIDSHIVSGMLESEVWDNAQTVAYQLAADLSRKDAPLTR